MRLTWRDLRVLALAALMTLAVVGLVTSAPASATSSQATPSKSPSRHSGGTLSEALISDVWPTLDPATNTQALADAQFFNLIYGELFQAGPKGKLLPDIATNYRYANNDLQIDIGIRPGVRFSDGHPLTASVVAWSMNRDLSQPSNFAVNFQAIQRPITSSGNTLVINLTHPDSAILEAFISQPLNWTADPYALQRMGTAAYGQHPVAAGPFMVKANVANQSLDLLRNPRYWQPGHPRLSEIHLLRVDTDQSAYAALQTGQVQIMGGAEGVHTIPLIKQIQAKGRFNVILTPATTYQFISLNQTKPPFNNALARRALIEATDTKALLRHLYGGLYTNVEGPTAPAELFYYGNHVNGYPGYNLAHARTLVRDLGGLTFNLTTTRNTTYWENEASALQAQWAKAGIKVQHIVLNTLTQTLQQLSANDWQALDSNWGIYIDPGAALPYYFSSSGQASGIHDPGLDQLITQGVSTVNPAARAQTYKAISEYMAKHNDVDFMYDKPNVLVAKKSVGWLPTFGRSYGEILWQNVYLKR